MGLFDAKVLAIGMLVLMIACLAQLTAAIAPFWFKLTTDVTYGSLQPRVATFDVGLFYMTDQFYSLLFLEKATNLHTAGAYLTMTQVFYIISFIGTVVCAFSALLLAIKKFLAVTAEIVLASFMTLSAGCSVLSVIFAILFSTMMAPINNIPENSRVLLEKAALVELSWAFYIGVIATVLCVVGAILLWVEACQSYNIVTGIRYRQMREKRSTTSAADKSFENFSYAQSPQRRQPPPNYKVTYQSAPANYPRYPPPRYESEPSPGYVPPVKMPPSPQGGYVSRQIDL